MLSSLEIYLGFLSFFNAARLGFHFFIVALYKRLIDEEIDLINNEKTNQAI